MPAISQAKYVDGMNLYEYVGSGPITRVDMNGLEYLTTNSTGLLVVVVESGDTLSSISRKLTGEASAYKLLSKPKSGNYDVVSLGESLVLSNTFKQKMYKGRKSDTKYMYSEYDAENNRTLGDIVIDMYGPPVADPAAADPAVAGQATLTSPKIYEGFVTTSAAKYGVPVGILKGLIKAESAWKPSARSGAGAVGLTQIMPGTAVGELGMTVNTKTDDRLDPKKSIDGGADYLKRQYVALYEGKTILERWRLALGAYNWGKGNINRKLRSIGKAGKVGTAKWCEIAPKVPKETRNYVKKILGESNNASGYAKEYGYAK